MDNKNIIIGIAVIVIIAVFYGSSKEIYTTQSSVENVVCTPDQPDDFSQRCEMIYNGEWDYTNHICLCPGGLEWDTSRCLGYKEYIDALYPGD